MKKQIDGLFSFKSSFTKVHLSNCPVLFFKLLIPARKDALMSEFLSKCTKQVKFKTCRMKTFPLLPLIWNWFESVSGVHLWKKSNQELVKEHQSHFIPFELMIWLHDYGKLYHNDTTTRHQSHNYYMHDGSFQTTRIFFRYVSDHSRDLHVVMTSSQSSEELSNCQYSTEMPKSLTSSNGTRPNQW